MATVTLRGACRYPVECKQAFDASAGHRLVGAGVEQLE